MKRRRRRKSRDLITLLHFKISVEYTHSSVIIRESTLSKVLKSNLIALFCSTLIFLSHTFGDHFMLSTSKQFVFLSNSVSSCPLIRPSKTNSSKT